MKKKIWILLLSLLLVIMGGCSTMNKQETLAKEQQDNVIRNIAKNYDIKSITFLSFSKDKKTGTYHLLLMINDNSIQTGISANRIDEYSDNMNIGLSPVEDFEHLKRRSPVEYEDINLLMIKIKYLKN